LKKGSVLIPFSYVRKQKITVIRISGALREFANDRIPPT
jgi:hypothetical protein